MMRNFAISLFGGIDQKVIVNVASPTSFGLPPPGEPDLTRFSLSDAFDDGGPDLFRLLRWDYGLVETLYGRDEELRAIIDWAESGGDTAKARLVAGEGGAGKTRLAAAAALTLRDKGWTAGFLPRGDAVLFDVAERGLFLILDYPEEQMARTRALLAKLAELKSALYPIRVLLLSRRPFEAWEDETAILEGRFGRQAIAVPGPLSIENAKHLITEAATRLADETGQPPPNLLDAAHWLNRSSIHALPLFALAAAIHAVLAPREAFGLGHPALMRDLAKREHRRVRHASIALGLGEDGLQQILALGVLADGLSETAIEELVKAGAVHMASGDVAGALARSPWWSGGRLIRLQPDRPAAAFMDLALFRSGFPEGRNALPDWLFIALSERANTLGERIGRIQYDLAAFGWIGPGEHPLARCLIAMVRRDPARATVFASIAFQEVSHWAASIAAEVALTLADRTEEPERRASLLNNGANCLSLLGRREEALERAEEATGLYGDLADARPDAFRPDLAMSLTTLATMLSELGRREEALERAEEAVRTLAPFFLSHSVAFSPRMGTMARVYLQACEAAERQPDLDLLGPIAERLQMPIPSLKGFGV